jgi:hypothetical protein
VKAILYSQYGASGVLQLKDIDKPATVIDRSYPVARIAEAFERVEQGHKKGNVLITVGASMNATIVATIIV